MIQYLMIIRTMAIPTKNVSFFILSISLGTPFPPTLHVHLGPGSNLLSLTMSLNGQSHPSKPVIFPQGNIHEPPLPLSCLQQAGRSGHLKGTNCITSSLTWREGSRYPDPSHQGEQRRRRTASAGIVVEEKSRLGCSRKVFWRHCFALGFEGYATFSS